MKGAHQKNLTRWCFCDNTTVRCNIDLDSKEKHFDNLGCEISYENQKHFMFMFMVPCIADLY